MLRANRSKRNVGGGKRVKKENIIRKTRKMGGGGVGVCAGGGGAEWVGGGGGGGGGGNWGKLPRGIGNGIRIFGTHPPTSNHDPSLSLLQAQLHTEHLLFRVLLACYRRVVPKASSTTLTSTSRRGEGRCSVGGPQRDLK